MVPSGFVTRLAIVGAQLKQQAQGDLNIEEIAFHAELPPGVVRSRFMHDIKLLSERMATGSGPATPAETTRGMSVAALLQVNTDATKVHRLRIAARRYKNVIWPMYPLLCNNESLRTWQRSRT